MLSRTHRVLIGWLFDSDSKIQIKYVDSKTQLADSFFTPTPTPERRDTVTVRMMSCLMRTLLSQAQNPSRLEAMLYIFEDNEAVINMLTKKTTSWLDYQRQLHP